MSAIGRVESERVLARLRLPARRGRLGVLVALAVVALALVLGHRYWLTALGQFLVVEDPPRPVDAIVVLGGGPVERVEYGSELYRQGYASWLVTTGGSVPVLPGFIDESWAELYRDKAISLGVPRDHVLLVDSRSTYEDALGVRHLADQQGWRSLLVVSEPYHMRRAALSFRKAFAGTGDQLAFRGVPRSWFRVEGWWTRTEEQRVVGSEYLKLAFQLVAYGF